MYRVTILTPLTLIGLLMGASLDLRRPAPGIAVPAAQWLAAREVYEFAFVIQPSKIQGATGASVAPVAIY